MSRWYWKRINYLTHRWVGIALGLLMLAWFASGVVMMYYPYPVLTESARDSLLEGWTLEGQLLSFPEAAEAARRDFDERGSHVAERLDSTLAGGRLIRWRGRPAWQIRHQRGYRTKPYILVDATSGAVLSPLDSAAAMQVASAGAPPGARPTRAELLPRGDHYMFWGTYHLEDFPVWRVRFDDRARTWVYVGTETGRVYARADRIARAATWVGTVPHWLYFMSLYEHPKLWTWLNLLLPGIAVVISLTGIVLGTYQLFPRRHQGEWRISPYHGVSLWHHLSGVGLGVLVFTWTLSGVFEMLGAGNDPRAGQAEAARGGVLRTEGFAVPVGDAVRAAVAAAEAGPELRYVEAGQLLGRAGYHVVLEDGSARWVDAGDGSVRAELTEADARAVAAAVSPADPPTAATRLDAYDAYYYHRHGREMHLPVWRVSLGGEEGPALYLHTMTGAPTGYVDRDTRLWRWLRDGVHSLDLPTLIRNRPAWDLVVLPLMLGGLLSSLTGVWLLVRRLRRKARR